MSIRISIPTKVYSCMDGFDVDTIANFDLSVHDAEALVRSINAQIPAEQARQKSDRLAEIEKLESRLRALKGASA